MYYFPIVLLLWVHICAGISWKSWNRVIEKRPQPEDIITTRNIRNWKRQDSHSIELVSGPKVSIGPAKSQIINTTWIYAPGSISTKVQGDMYFWSGLYGEDNHEDGDSLRVICPFFRPAPRMLTVILDCD
jgi:hypothetical protein